MITYAQSPNPAWEEYIGVWEVADSQGKTFRITLMAGGNAVSDWGTREIGTWKVEGMKCICRWKDGWVDVLVKDELGYYKLGYEPGKSLSEKPSNRTFARKLL